MSYLSYLLTLVSMKITGNIVLITGGATGIGLALSEAFLREGNEVIICGRASNLRSAPEKMFSIINR